jgi:hypothetical protein
LLINTLICSVGLGVISRAIKQKNTQIGEQLSL